MLTRLERSIANNIRPIILRPSNLRETAILAPIQTKENVAYPGELKYPRRMDLQLALPLRNGRSFLLNIEINRGAAYSELKRSRMLDPHLVERCDRVHGHNNYLTVLIVGTNVKPSSQHYKEMERYFTPDRTYNLWVIPCSENFTREEVADVGNRIRNKARLIMGLN
jgi:hypothetical protein